MALPMQVVETGLLILHYPHCPLTKEGDNCNVYLIYMPVCLTYVTGQCTQLNNKSEQLTPLKYS